MAATDLERLVVQLSADIKKYENAMSRAQGVTNRRLGAMQKQATTSSRAIAASFARTGAQIAGAFLASEVIRSAVTLSDAATRIDNSLKVAGLSGEELERVYQRLSKAAVENGAPIETLAALYGKAAQNQKELGVTTDELIGFTNNVALALRVAGTDAASASGALLQLGQALGAGKVQAEEFNSILEGAPTIAQAVAAGLKEAGGSVSRLKGLVVDGKISSEAFFRAFEAGAPVLQEKVKGSVFTIEQASENMKSALIDLVKEFNNSTGASKNFANGINSAAKVVADFDVASLINKLRSGRAELENFFAGIKLPDSLSQMFGISDTQGNVLNPAVGEAQTKIAGLERELELLQQRLGVNTELGFDNKEALARIQEVQAQLTRLRAQAANLPAFIDGYRIGENGFEAVPGGSDAGTNGQMGGSGRRGGARRRAAEVKPVSVNDFKPPVGRGGGGSKAKSAKEDDYARETKQIQERTKALAAETTAQSMVNPLINDYGFAIEKARSKQELLTAAQEAGKKVTPELAKEIENLSTSYALAVVESERLAEKQDEIRQRAEDALATAKDVTRGIIDGFTEGAEAGDILVSSLKKIGDALINDVLDSLFKVNNAGGGGGGFLSGLLGLFGGGGSGFKANTTLGAVLGAVPGFAKGTNFAPGGVAVVGEKGPELVNLPRGAQVIPKIPKAMGGAGVTVSMPIQIDATGADSAGLARVERQIAQLKADLPAQVVASVKNAQKRRTI
jgi:tape measure domain-containing protein